MKHWPDVRDKLAFLQRLMTEFTGGRMSLEGNLTRCTFPAEVILARDDDAVLRRNTICPRQDFVIVRLDPNAITSIFLRIKSAGLSRDIIHVQIERDGVLELGAYDSFCPGCVVTGPGVSPTLLAELEESRILRGFQAAISTDGL
jgi:hypothetical protein